MDETRIIRKLVTGQYMRDFDYKRTKYSFRTLWFRSAYSYRFCSCGFQHEYLDYITESGSINEEIYEKVLLCVLAGHCPHVYNVPPEYIHETSIYGMHIAAATSTYGALKEALDPRNKITGTLFRLNAYQLSFIKNLTLASEFKLEACLLSKHSNIVEANKLRTVNPETNKIRLEEKSFIEYCVRKGKASALELENIVDLSKHDFISTLQIAFKYNLGELQELLKRKWHKLGGIENILEECCTLAVVYDKPEFLHFLLHRVSQHWRVHCKTDTGRNLCKMCDVLQRWNCKQVLLIKQNFLSGGTYNKLDALNTDITDVVKSIVNSLFTYNMRQEHMAVLRMIPNISSILNHIEGDRGSILHAYNCKSLNIDIHLLAVTSVGKTDDMCDASLLKTILALNVDVNHVDRNGMPPLIHLLHLKRISYNNLFRDAEELYIFENPDLDLHKTALLHGLRVDKVLYQMDTNNIPIVLGKRRIYIMDGKEHGLQGHDGSDLALNFMVPFLIECGFPMMEDCQGEFENEKDSLHPVEQVYITQCLQTPRSLLFISRDALRRHYKGRRVHRFVEMVNIPPTVKDFILLKPLLKCVPKKLLH